MQVLSKMSTPFTFIPLSLLLLYVRDLGILLGCLNTGNGTQKSFDNVCIALQFATIIHYFISNIIPSQDFSSKDRTRTHHVYCKINKTFRFCNFLTMTSICVDVIFTTEYYIIADFEFVFLLPVWPYTSQSQTRMVQFVTVGYTVNPLPPWPKLVKFYVVIPLYGTLPGVVYRLMSQ